MTIFVLKDFNCIWTVYFWDWKKARGKNGWIINVISLHSQYSTSHFYRFDKGLWFDKANYPSGYNFFFT